MVEVEPRNVLCEFHDQQLWNKSNIWLCLLPSHSSTLSDTPISMRLYKLLDKAGKSKACYHLGTCWCTSCWRNNNKTFATKTTHKKPVRRKMLDSYIPRLSSPAGFSRFPYFTHLHNKQSKKWWHNYHHVCTRRSIT